jgi:hypothetical protein
MKMSDGDCWHTQPIRGDESYYSFKFDLQKKCDDISAELEIWFPDREKVWTGTLVNVGTVILHTWMRQQLQDTIDERC